MESAASHGTGDQRPLHIHSRLNGRLLSLPTRRSSQVITNTCRSRKHYGKNVRGMVYKGKPSAGCENCRKAKKKCEQSLPACARCVRLGKACGGYRDMSDLIFRNETDSVTRRASAQGEPGPSASASSPRSRSPDIQTTATRFFFEQFVTPAHFSYLQGISPDEFLLKPITACALMAMANRDDDDDRRGLARRYYVDAITATNAALRHPRRVKEDNTLISVCLLSVFERLTWEPSSHSGLTWRHHIEGAAQVLNLRGRGQIRTTMGAMLFRDLRDAIINNCSVTEVEVPDYMIQWTQALEHDPMFTPADQLSILSTRMASLRAAFKTGSKPDHELSELAHALEKDLLDWSENTLAAGSVCSFYDVRDPDSPHAWNGTRHEYGIPLAHRKWNIWRCMRIALSRMQEALWRRSWPILAQPTTIVPSADHFATIRERMTNDICISVAYALGNSPDVEPPDKGGVSSGVILILPLTTAGTCLLEKLSEPVASPGGSRMILVEEPLHTDLFNQTSTQLAWIIERLEYISAKIGVKWAEHMARFLKGEKRVYYDLGRSSDVRDVDIDTQLFAEMLDLRSVGSFSEFEE